MAALAEVLCTMLDSMTSCSSSKQSTWRPMSLGAMKYLIAPATEGMVSPVMTAVGGASP